MESQSCPLCGLTADFTTQGERGRKLFSCPNCKYFYIDFACERYLEEIPEVAKTEFRQKLSDLSKLGENGRRLVIREPFADEIHGSGHGVARERLFAKLVDINE